MTANPTEQKPHSRDLRKGRVSIPGQAYLVTTITAGRAPLFADLKMGRVLVGALRHQQQRGSAESLAFVIMPDHLHWLFTLGERHSLSQAIGQTKRYSAQRINQMRGNKGQAVWQDGFHDHAIRREEDLREVARYIIANPVRAGLVTRVGDYPLWDACWF
jgi:REP element-mobilizing transposase RayT